jgi:sulfotransferase family protein
VRGPAWLLLYALSRRNNPNAVSYQVLPKVIEFFPAGRHQLNQLLRKARNRFVGAFRAKPRISAFPALMAEKKASGPDFICFGGQKGGTRWLFDQLSHHPDFWMTPVKELHYINESIRVWRAEPLYARAFANIDHVNRHREEANMRLLDPADIKWLEALIWLERQPYNLELYARLFNPKGSKLSGDITPTYSLVSDDRIAHLLRRFPNAKILFFARDPIDRFWSQYCMVAAQKDWENPSDPAIVERFINDRNGLRHSALTEIVRRWRRSDTENAFGLFFFDDLLTDAASFRRRVVSFLGGDPHKPSGKLPPGFNRKSRYAKVIMRPEVRERLIELLGDEIRACAKEFGGPASEWPIKYGL